MVIELDAEYINRRNEIEEVVKSILNEHNLELSQTIIDNLIIHLSLSISRELNGTYIPTSESQINHLKEHAYYKVAKQIVRTLEEKYSVSIFSLW